LSSGSILIFFHFLFRLLRYRATSVEEIFRAENTTNYEGKIGEGSGILMTGLAKEGEEVVGISGNKELADFVDEKVNS
jgi:hypothetical protein